MDLRKIYKKQSDANVGRLDVYVFAQKARKKAYGLKHWHPEFEDGARVQAAMAELCAIVDQAAMAAKAEENKAGASVVDLMTENSRGNDLLKEKGDRLSELLEEYLDAVGAKKKVEAWARPEAVEELAKIRALDIVVFDPERCEVAYPRQGVYMSWNPDAKKINEGWIPRTGGVVKAELRSSLSSMLGLRFGFGAEPGASLGLGWRDDPETLNVFNPWGWATGMAKAWAAGDVEKTLSCALMGKKSISLTLRRQESSDSAPWLKVDQAAHKAFEDRVEALAQETAKKFVEAIGAEKFCQGYWGKRCLEAADLSELAWAYEKGAGVIEALDGAGPLGVVSLQLGSMLGVSPSVDLPQRVFEKLSSMGMSKGGWRLLGRVEDSEGLLTNFGFESLGRAAKARDKDGNRIKEGKSVMEQMLWDAEPAVYEQWKSSEVNRKLSWLAKWASAGAERGLEPSELASGARELVRALGGVLSEPLPEFEKKDSGEKAEASYGGALGDLMGRMRWNFGHNDDCNPQWQAAAGKISEAFATAWKSSPARACGKIRLIADYMQNSEEGSAAEWMASSDDPKELWRGLDLRQAQWHEMVAARERGEAAAKCWKPLDADWPSRPGLGARLVELVDGGQLYDEGKALRHCVSTYASKCERGARRILSLEVDGAKRATLELVRTSDGSWSQGQFKGLRNKDVETEAFLDMARKAVAQACLAQKRLDQSALEAENPEIGIGAKLATKREQAGAQQAAEFPRAR